MIGQRIKRERKIILLLAVLVIAIYGITFGIKAIQSKRAEETQEHIAPALISITPDSITVTNDTEPYILTRNETGWVCVGNSLLRISNAKIIFMLATFKDFNPQRLIFDGAKHFEEFGLDYPRTTITLDVAGTEKSYHLGNYNPVLNEYYVNVDDSSNVYLISAEDAMLINRTLLQLIEPPEMVEITTGDIAEINISSKERYTISNEGASFKVKWNSRTFDSSQYRVSNLLSAFSAADYECKCHRATNEDMSYCGLKKPDVAVDILLNDGTTFKLVVGTGQDGIHYLNENGNGIIYRIDDDYYGKIIERTMLSSLGYEN